MKKPTLEEAILKLKQQIKKDQAALSLLEKINEEWAEDDKSVTSPAIEALQNKNSDFPLNDRQENQILYIVKSEFKKGSKASQIEEALADRIGKENVKHIINPIRKLKQAKKLVLVKYNSTNKQSFWGLPEWVDEEAKDFKDEFKPEKSELPYNVFKSEIIR